MGASARSLAKPGATFSLKNYLPYRLVLGKTGPHRFGGSPAHDGAIPRGTNVALHHFLSLDLSDPNCPIRTESAIRYLPLYYFYCPNWGWLILRH